VNVVWLELKGEYLHTILSSNGGEKFRKVGLDSASEDPTTILGDPDDVVIEVVDTGSGLADSHGMILVQMFWEHKSPGKNMPLLVLNAPRGGSKFISPPEGGESSFAFFYSGLSGTQKRVLTIEVRTLAFLRVDLLYGRYARGFCCAP
jgi:hypothetical protein